MTYWLPRVEQEEMDDGPGLISAQPAGQKSTRLSGPTFIRVELLKGQRHTAAPGDRSSP
jgi:hypothetical protein